MRQVDGTGALTRVRQLRHHMPEAEKKLWSALRNRRLEGFKFRRQMCIGPYIADFCCREAKLVVEVDGSQHGDRTGYDEARSTALAKEGYRVLRFWNNEVMGDLEAVLIAILSALVPSPSHSASPIGPLPLPEGERGL